MKINPYGLVVKVQTGDYMKGIFLRLVRPLPADKRAYSQNQRKGKS